jgi:transposase
MKKDITLTQQDQQRLRVIEQIEAGRWTATEGAAALGLSARQVYRLKVKHEQQGAGALIHGNRGRAPQNRIREEERAQIVRLATETYVKCSASHLRDLLVEREGIVLSSKSIGRILREAAIPSSRKRRLPRHRVRRDRMEQEGMLCQVDGSDHHWFGKERPRATLLGAIDDATGNVVAAVFREHEDAQGYLLLLQQILKQRGIPLELYHDRHGIFEQNRPKWSVAEELRGELDPTQVTRALGELGITSIAAHSPQAKGRIERLWGTWQDRLVKELALDGVTDIEAANAYLPGYNERHNARFAVTPADPGLAYRRLDPSLDLDRVLSFRSERVVANDNTVQFERQRLQIPAEPWRRSYARARVDVHQFLDGGLGIWYQGNWLLRTPSAAHPPTLRAPKRTSKRTAPSPDLVAPRAPQQVSLPQPTPARKATPPKPAANHPWRRQSLSNRPPLTESLSG